MPEDSPQAAEPFESMYRQRNTALSFRARALSPRFFKLYPKE
jgi:hypothetical protein